MTLARMPPMQLSGWCQASAYDGRNETPRLPTRNVRHHARGWATRRLKPIRFREHRALATGPKAKPVLAPRQLTTVPGQVRRVRLNLTSRRIARLGWNLRQLPSERCSVLALRWRGGSAGS